MKSSSIIGIAFLVIAVSLAVYEPFLQKIGSSQPVVTEPTPYAAGSGDLMPQNDSDYQAMQPRHEPIPPRRHTMRDKHKKAMKHAVHHAAPKPTHAPEAPLPGPTFLPSTPEPAPTVEISTLAPSKVPVIENYHPPVVPPVVHRVKPRRLPTIYAPPTLSPRDLARQRQLERAALIDAATRTARATVTSTLPTARILSAEADDHGTSISVVVVEQRTTGIVVESFVFTPGGSALGLAQRRVISQNNADPYVSH